MNAFLAELGKKLAERWVSLLVVPGALFVALAAAGSALGHRHALDRRLLGLAVEELATHYDRRPVSAVLLFVAVLAAAAVAGLLARALGTVVERAWLISGPAWLTGRLVRRRKDRWTTAAERAAAGRAPAGRPAAEQAPAGRSAAAEQLAADRAALAEERNAIALTRPARATWIGDRLRGVGVRVHAQYGLDFPFAWPRLWTLLPEACRNDLIAAREALAGAATQSGWGLLYLCLGLVWWPAAGAGAALMLLGWRRGREAAANLADLTEATVDLYAADLALLLGVDLPSGHVTPAVGRQLSERFRKGA
ncbi:MULTISPECIES: hypothetical protein [Streptomyces]|uniref:hypothetical protein n=1 Tax=Streptomyces TaxID=1883 RepID=UPI0007CD809D|nr:hypothetical protein A4V12_18915 [Streptomyces noursei]